MEKIHFVYADEGTFNQYLRALPDKDPAKLLKIIKWVQNKGMALAIQMKWVKKLDDNLYELRAQQGNDIQRVIYFHLEGSEYVITHGFTKKTEKTSIREINRGKRLRGIFVRRDEW